MAVGAEEGRGSSSFTNFDDQADFLGLSMQTEFILDLIEVGLFISEVYER